MLGFEILEISDYMNNDILGIIEKYIILHKNDEDEKTFVNALIRYQKKINLNINNFL
jgi:hypothetical protein